MLRTMLLIGAISLAAAPATAIGPKPLFPVIASVPSDPIGYRSLTLAAKAAFDAGDYAKSETLYRQATQLYPVDWINWRYLAASLRLQNKYRESIDAYQRLIDLSGTYVGSGRYWQAVAYTRLGERDKALATLRQIVFDDHEIDRPALAYDENFKPYWDHGDFRALVAPAAASGIDRVAGWRGDLAYLVAEIRRLSPDHRKGPLPPTTQALVDRLERDIPSLSDEQMFARLSEIIGSLKQNHTMFWGSPPPGTPGPKPILSTTFLPLQLYAFPDGIYVVNATAAQRRLIGGRIETIGGTDVAEVVKGIDRTTSYGSSAEFAWSGPPRMAIVPLLHGLGYAKSGQPVAMTLSRAGKKEKVLLDPVGEPVAFKLGAPPDVPAPRFLQNVDNPHRFEILPDKRTVYAQFNQVVDGKDETLADFGRKLRTAIADPAIDSLIVDLRLNNGGNSFLYTELMRTLVAFSTRPNAQVYALIGRSVYSAAGNFVTDLERLANPVFVGEPTGNMGNQHGDEGKVRLPYSGLTATIAAVKWQLSNPWDTRGTIVPHVPVALTSADYFAGRDPVMDTTLKLIAERRR